MFEPKRSDGIYHSAACKQAAYRRRQRERRERARVTNEIRRDLRRDDAADVLRQLIDVARRAGAISANDLGAVADRIEDPGERRLWLGRVALDAADASHALRRLAALTEVVDGPIVFNEGFVDINCDGVAPTLAVAGGALVVFVPPSPPA